MRKFIAATFKNQSLHQNFRKVLFRNYKSHPQETLTFTGCCEEIVLKSTIHSQEQLKSLGKYILKPIDVVENHPVYKHETSDEHIAFSADYAWEVRYSFFCKIGEIVIYPIHLNYTLVKDYK